MTAVLATLRTCQEGQARRRGSKPWRHLPPSVSGPGAQQPNFSAASLQKNSIQKCDATFALLCHSRPTPQGAAPLPSMPPPPSHITAVGSFCLCTVARARAGASQCNLGSEAGLAAARAGD